MTLSYLDLIDYDAVHADPKPLLGFSDISTLHLALHARTGLVSVHSDLVTHGFGYWHESDETRRKELEDIYLRVLTGDGAPGALRPAVGGSAGDRGERTARWWAGCSIAWCGSSPRRTR